MKQIQKKTRNHRMILSNLMMRLNRQRGVVGGVFDKEVRIHSSRSSSSLARAPQSAALAAPAPDHVLAMEGLHSFIIK